MRSNTIHLGRYYWIKAFGITPVLYCRNLRVEKTASGQNRTVYELVGRDGERSWLPASRFMQEAGEHHHFPVPA